MEKKQIIIGQIIFWVLLFMVEAAITTNFLEVKSALYGVLIDLLFAMVVFYFNLYVLFPRFYKRDKIKQYFILNILLLVLVVFIQGSLISYKIQKAAIDVERLRDIPKLMPYNKSLTWLLLIDLISFYFPIISTIKEKEIKNKELVQQKLETEIKFLKAQISPHFVFNALNNIYSLTYSKSDKAPESVIKLSQMLRYVYYEGNKEQVSINSEVEYIENFIAFQEMKSPHKQNIKFTKKISQSIDIAPMLLIPFIENSFKYSKIEEIEDAKVEIEISCDTNKLKFSISNSYPKEHPVQQGSGMGIENVKKRLDLIYPDKYIFEVTEDNNIFYVFLEIEK